VAFGHILTEEENLTQSSLMKTMARPSIERSALPLYHRVYMALRGRIEQGYYANGSLLPTEAQVADEFGVSRITAKRALNDLAAVGMVERSRGRGSVVCYKAGERPLESSIDGLLSSLADIRRESRIKVLRLDTRPAFGEPAEKLGVLPGTPLREVVRLRYTSSGPLSYSTAWLRTEHTEKWSIKLLNKTAIFDLLQDAGIRIGAADQTMYAISADTEAADALAIDVSAPLLAIDRVVQDPQGQPIAFSQIRYRSDRFRVRIRLMEENGSHSLPMRGK